MADMELFVSWSNRSLRIQKPHSTGWDTDDTGLTVRNVSR
jgi:hypothetical protein